MFRSIRVRLTAWYVVVLALILAAFCVGLYFAMRANLYSNMDDSLETRAEALDGVIDSDSDAVSISSDSAPQHPEGEEFVRLFGSSGEVVYDNTVAGLSPDVDEGSISTALQGSRTNASEATSDDTMRVLTVPVRRDGAIVGVLQVGRSEDDIQETLSTLLLIIAAGYPLTIIIATAGGAFLAGRALKPVGELTSVARQITAEDLSRRLNLQLPDDEVGRLARTFDEMIARLDEAFRRQRQFTADASHELRTPLTAIKGQTEVALQRERFPSDYQDVLRAVNSDVDRMIRLVGSLLTLARADAGQTPIARERLDLGRLVKDAADQLDAVARAKQVTLSVQVDPVGLVGDQDLLLQLVLNLLDNAIKYTPAGGTVTVSCAREANAAVVAVRDTGPGIAPQHLPRIFDRFYRVDPSRSESGSGSGLGLSIARWIAEVHGGSLDASSELARGSTFTLRIPLSQ